MISKAHKNFLSTALIFAFASTLSVQSASAENYHVQFDGGGECLINNVSTAREFFDYPSQGKGSEKVVAVVDYVDAASSARRLLTTSAGGLFIGNYKD